MKSSVLATTAFLLITAQSSGFSQTLPALGTQAGDTKSQNAQGLSIQQAIQNALTQNPVMQQSQAMIDEAKGAIQEASGNRLPQLDFSFGGMASNNALNVFCLLYTSDAADE